MLLAPALRAFQRAGLRVSILIQRATSADYATVNIRPPVNGRFAHVGQHVRTGEVLGYVKPVMAEIDRSDFEQTAGQLDQEIALAENRVTQFKRFATFPTERIRTAEIELENLVRRRATLAERKAVNEPLIARARSDATAPVSP